MTTAQRNDGSIADHDTILSKNMDDVMPSNSAFLGAITSKSSSASTSIAQTPMNMSSDDLEAIPSSSSSSVAVTVTVTNTSTEATNTTIPASNTNTKDISIRDTSAEPISIRDVSYTTDFAALCAIYVNAFEHQRQYINVSQKQGQEHRDLLDFVFTRRLKIHEAKADTPESPILLVAMEGGKIVGTGGIERNSAKVSFYDLYQAGFFWLPWVFGWSSLLRASQMRGSGPGDTPDPAGGKVVMMAVDIGLQGKGIGGMILERMIERWDTEGGGVLTLMTQLEGSAKFYEKYGFETTGVVKRDGYSNWTMKRNKSEVRPLGAVSEGDVEGSERDEK